MDPSTRGALYLKSSVARMSGEGRAGHEFQRVDVEGENDNMKSCAVNELGTPNDHESSKTDTDLDAAIEEAAKRRNLSTLNVKSIIHVRLVNQTIIHTVKGQIVCPLKDVQIHQNRLYIRPEKN